MTIDPGASGDSFVQFDINATGEFRIGVDDTDDSFRISQGSALGTNDTFVMSAAGERTMPLQPAFLAYLGTTDSSVTGKDALFTLGSGNALTEVYDQGGDFVTTGTFTAPVTGRYSFSAGIYSAEMGDLSYWIIDLLSSNANYILYMSSASMIEAGSDSFSVTLNHQIDMDASDTASIRVRGTGDNKNDVDLLAVGRNTFFSGYLIC